MLVQVVEHIEERALGTLSLQVLDVVDDQDIDLHIEGQEVGQLVADVDGIHILRLELVAADIEDDEVRILLVDADADGLREVRLAEAWTAENEERVERRVAGRKGDVLPHRDAHLVAFTRHQVGEAVHRIEAGVDVDPLQAGIHEGAGRSAGLVGADRDGLVDRRVAVDGGKLHRGRHLDGADLIDQPGIGADHALERHLDDIQVGVFQILTEEVARDLDGQGGADKGNGPDRLEPGLVLSCLDYLGDNAKTVFPNIDMSVVDLHYLSLCPALEKASCPRKATFLFRVQKWMKKKS